MSVKLNYKNNNQLIPTVIQDYNSGKVLMLGFMNKEAYEKTSKSGLVYFFSRSRKKLWLKGEKSGNKLKVKSLYADCDNDSLLVKIEILGKYVCHKGYKSCFYKKILSR